MWKQQKQRVETLSLLAGASAAETARLRAEIRGWKARHFGTLHALAWAFTVGARFAPSPVAAHRLALAGRGLTKIISAAWLVWGLIDRGQLLTRAETVPVRIGRI